MSLTLDSTGSDMMTSVTFLNDATTTSSHGAFVYRKHLCRASLNYPQCALALAKRGLTGHGIGSPKKGGQGLTPILRIPCMYLPRKRRAGPAGCNHVAK